MDTESKEILINLVKQFPCIYDPHAPGYDCVTTYKTVWKVIDDEMGVPSPTGRKMWEALLRRRKNFRAFQQKLEKESGSGCQVSWQWEKEMSFMDKYEGGFICRHKRKAHRPTVPVYETKKNRNEDYLNEYPLDDDQLIECIKNYPILTENFNGSIKAKTAAWNDIANKMGYTVTFCQSWWKKLRTQYRQELCNHKRGRSSTWEHFHKMDFAKVYVSFNIGTSSDVIQSDVILRYFNKLGKFLENAPQEKRAELDNQILNLILEAELNHYQENTIDVLDSPQSNLSENDATPSSLSNAQPANKYIVQVVPDGGTSLENISEEYEINFLPDDFNIDAPLIECKVEKPGKIEQEVENVEIEEIEYIEVKEELEDVELKEELEYLEVKDETEYVETEGEDENMETKKDENVMIQEAEYVETQKAENMEVQEEAESMKIKEEAESMKVKEEVKIEVINEETEEADIIKVLEQEDEDMIGCYVLEVTDE